MCERWGQTSRDDSTNEGLLLQIYVRQLRERWSVHRQLRVPAQHLRWRGLRKVLCSYSAWLAGLFLGRHPGALFAGFGEPDGDGLLAALHAATFAGLA